MTIFFTNPNLASMQEYISYKNVDIMRVLLIKLPDGKLTWWNRGLSICSTIADVTPKKFLIYYLEFISAF